MSPIPPGTLIHERYDVIRLIATGGMGAVYEATDRRLRSRVALKQTLLEGDALMRAFEREAQLLAGLRHRMLPRVTDYFADGANGTFLVMEYIPGDDLATLLERHGRPFAAGDVVVWTEEILGALEYLHGQRPPVVHRDIKPRNLKLTPGGELVLLDFGLAKGSVALGTQASTSTMPSLFGYSPQYAPLEQLQGTGTDPRTDVYGVGATMFHLLTGQPPPGALDRSVAIIDGRPDPLVSPTALNPSVSSELSGLVLRAMAIRSADRFQSATEMRAGLQDAIAGTDATAAERRRRAADQPTLTMAPGVAPGGHDPAAVTTPPAAMPAPPPVQPANGRFTRVWPWLAGLAAVAVLAVSAFFYARQPARDQGTVSRAGTLTFADRIARAGAVNRHVFDVPSAERMFVQVKNRDDSVAMTHVQLLDASDHEVFKTILGGGQPGLQRLQAGAHTLVVGAPEDTGTGAYRIVITRVPPEATVPLTLDARVSPGSPTRDAGRITVPGQSAAYTFPGQAGEQIFVQIPKHDDEAALIDVRLVDPDDEEVFKGVLGGGHPGVQTLRKGGTYRLIVGDQTDPGTGSYSLALTRVPKPREFAVALDAQIRPDQPAGAGVIDAPGAKHTYTFSGAPGESVFVHARRSHAGMELIDVKLLDPLDRELFSGTLGGGAAGRQVLRAGGVYRLIVGDDKDPATGEYEIGITRIPPVHAFDIAPDVKIGPGTPGPGAGEIRVPGETASYAFQARAGEHLTFTTLRHDDEVSLTRMEVRDDGDEPVKSSVIGGGAIDVTFPKDGRYRLVVGDDRNAGTGTYEIRIERTATK